MLGLVHTLPLGIVFFTLYIIQISQIITFAEPITLFILIEAAAGIASLVSGGASLSNWLRNRANFEMTTAIFEAFILQAAIPSGDIQTHVANSHL
jgi:hypothetical protein